MQIQWNRDQGDSELLNMQQSYMPTFIFYYRPATQPYYEHVIANTRNMRNTVETLDLCSCYSEVSEI